MNRLIYLSAWCVLGSCFVLVVLLTYWSTYPYKLMIEHRPVTMTKPVFVYGEDLSYIVDITNLVGGIQQTVIRSVESTSIIKNYPPYAYITKKGRLTTTILFPPGQLPPGKYRLWTRILFHVNPIRDIEIDRISGEFEISLPGS